MVNLSFFSSIKYYCVQNNLRENVVLTFVYLLKGRYLLDNLVNYQDTKQKLLQEITIIKSTYGANLI